MATYGYMDNVFTAVIDEQGVIWEAGTGRKRQAVGVDAQREQEYQAQITEMQGVIENYYNKLVELGAIIPPKSAEQIAQEQAIQQSEINQKLLEAIRSLQSEIGELKNNGVIGNGNELGNGAIGQISESIGEKPTGSQKRNATGTKNAPRSDE